MKKILTSVLTIALVVTVVGGATIANFFDTETSTNNTFTAGTLDLKTNNADGTTASYTLTNMKPGDWKSAGQVTLKNAGSISGQAWYEITNVRNLENGCLETEDESGDVTCEAGDDQGELGGLTKAFLQANVSPWTHYPASGVATINAAEGIRYDIKVLNPGDTHPVTLYGVWNAGALDNMAQGDSIVFDIVFHLDQI